MTLRGFIRFGHWVDAWIAPPASPASSPRIVMKVYLHVQHIGKEEKQNIMQFLDKFIIPMNWGSIVTISGIL
jgi:hypothetical protein